jgi:hypothetical protein
VNRPVLNFIRVILRHPVAVIVAAGLLFIAAAAVLPNLHIDNSVDVFFNKDGERFIHFQEWKRQFGTDEVIMVAIRADDIFTPENLALIDDLTRSFESLAHVDQVTSLTNVNTTIGQDQDFIIEYLVEEIPQDAASLAALKQKAVCDPLYVKNVVSPDGTVAAVLIELAEDQGGGREGEYKKEVILGVMEILKARVPQEVAYHISGLTAIEYFYAAYMQEDFKAFMPLL